MAKVNSRRRKHSGVHGFRKKNLARKMTKMTKEVANGVLLSGVIGYKIIWFLLELNG
ncbi:hypothetical protein YC2023_072559 [Brassica napus]